MSGSFELGLSETRPNGKDRQTRVICNVQREIFKAISRIDENVVEFFVDGHKPSVMLNGSTVISEKQAKEFRATPERALMLRNYYTYLYGLPMKLRDPGTRLPSETVVTTFQGQDVYALRVTYDENVGADTWYFYFHPRTFALVGYRFYHDESKGDGEYIILEGEYRSGTVRLPKVRKWYTSTEDRHLGTDTVTGISLE